MILRAVLPILLALMGITSATPPPDRTTPGVILPSVMALGDSYTLGWMDEENRSGYRGRLGLRVAWVGSLTDENGMKHEGHSGYRIADLTPSIPAWMGGVVKPKTVLLHIGTNDVDRGGTTEQMLRDLGALLDAIHKAVPGARVILSEIPAIPRDSAAQNAILRAYNAAMGQRIVAPRAGYVRLVDQTTTEIGKDGIHPDAKGYNRMAGVFRAVLVS